MALSRRRNGLLIALGIAGAVYLFTRTNMGQSVTASAADKLARVLLGHEGSRLAVYLDTAKKWTVGKGHLILPTDTVSRDQKAVKLHPYGPVMQITPAEEAAFFERDTSLARNTVANGVKVPLTENERVALTSLAFNIGHGGFMGSTLLALLNAGRKAEAAERFADWNKVTVNGVKVVDIGLTNRRKSERALFLS